MLEEDAAPACRRRGGRRGDGPQAAQAQAERPDPLAPTPEEEDGEPDFFEQYWPYFVAALLLGGMITAIAVTSSADAPDQPVLRFVPGGR